MKISKIELCAVAVLAGAVMTATPVLADDNICVEHPRADWISEEKLAEMATTLGYDVRKVEEEDGCWEVKGFDEQGNRVEVYFDPVSAEVIKIKN